MYGENEHVDEEDHEEDHEVEYEDDGENEEAPAVEQAVPVEPPPVPVNNIPPVINVLPVPADDTPNMPRVPMGTILEMPVFLRMDEPLVPAAPPVPQAEPVAHVEPVEHVENVEPAVQPSFVEQPVPVRDRVNIAVDQARAVAVNVVDHARDLQRAVSAQLDAVDPAIILATRQVMEQVQQKAPEKVAAVTRVLQQALGALNGEFTPKTPPANAAQQKIDETVNRLRMASELASLAKGSVSPTSPGSSASGGSILSRVAKAVGSASAASAPNCQVEMSCLLQLVVLDTEDRSSPPRAKNWPSVSATCCMQMIQAKAVSIWQTW